MVGSHHFIGLTGKIATITRSNHRDPLHNLPKGHWSILSSYLAQTLGPPPQSWDDTYQKWQKIANSHRFTRLTWKIISGPARPSRSPPQYIRIHRLILVSSTSFRGPNSQLSDSSKGLWFHCVTPPTKIQLSFFQYRVMPRENFRIKCAS